MKKIIYIVLFSLVVACDGDKVSDCFKKSGRIIKQEITVSNFTKIVVNRDVELIVEQGIVQKVVVETGENLLHDVTAIVTDGKLTLTDNNTCNYIRDYGITKVYVTSPNITEIRSSTQYTVSSKGVLEYPNLTVLSEDYNKSDLFTNGDFNLQIKTDFFRLVFNNISIAYISGTTNNLDLVFASGTSRFEGRDLIAENVEIWNRSSNDMIVNPQQSIKGEITVTGNVICTKTPPVIDVDTPYKGRLIFE